MENTQLIIKCPKHNEIFCLNVDIEKQKGVLLIDCPYCEKQHKITFEDNTKVDVYRALEL